MARSKLTEIEDDLITDSGSVLWSFIKGEQLEFPITMNFIEDVTSGYTYEAVVVEGANISGQDTPPVTIQPNGVQTNIVVRVPTKRGNWSAVDGYNKEDVVLYNGIYYKILLGSSRVNATPPNLDPVWQVTSLSKIYIQFSKTLGSTWAVAPIVGKPVYGFFELRVTEPNDAIFSRTWKPVRGMVEILFSPTDIVPDI
jgi:hypothetical protein